MYNSNTFTLSGTPEELARVLRCSVSEFTSALQDLSIHNAAVLDTRHNVVTLISRRLQRLHKSRESMRLRKQSQRERQKCHTQVTSASVSASIPVGIGDRGKGRNLAPQLRTEIGKHFNRKPDDRWAYDEEFALVAVCKRPAAESEWLEILRFRKAAAKNGDRIREKLIATLENWPAELDRARNYKLPGASSAKIQTAKEYLDGAPAIVPVSDQTKAEWQKMKETLK